VEGAVINMANYGNAFHSHCRRKDLGLNSYLLCLEDNPDKCVHSLPFGNDFFCKCPRILAFHSQKQEGIEFDIASSIQSSHLKKMLNNGYEKDESVKRHFLRERRRYYRIRIDLPIYFTFSDKHEIKQKEGVSLDISDTGMCFYTDAPLQKGAQLQLSVQYVWDSPRGSTVRWCNMITNDLYRVGVSFQ
jgi:hypothetical protein